MLMIAACTRRPHVLPPASPLVLTVKIHGSPVYERSAPELIAVLHNASSNPVHFCRADDGLRVFVTVEGETRADLVQRPRRIAGLYCAESTMLVPGERKEYRGARALLAPWHKGQVQVVAEFRIIAATDTRREIVTVASKPLWIQVLPHPSPSW
jgi:hypothetical protein